MSAAIRSSAIGRLLIARLTNRQQLARGVIAVLVGVLAFVYRFNTLGGTLGGFDNDHFEALARGMHVYHGELPLRDFAEAELRGMWPSLTYMMFGVGQRLFGESLRSEAITTVGLLAFGAAALFWVAADVARARVPAVLVALVAIVLSPTLYNHPKIVPYVLAVAAMLAFARQPTTPRLLVLAVVVMIATLFRHDHGVYLGLASCVLIATTENPNRVRALRVFALAVVVGLLPGLVFVQRHGGLVEYVRQCLELSGQEARRTTANAVWPVVDWRAPLLVRVAPPDRVPRIAVLWEKHVTRDVRAEREREHGLTHPVPRGNDQNWGYDLPAPSPSRIEALVRDPAVVDTDGIDRESFRVMNQPVDPTWVRWQKRFPVLQSRLAPGILRESNAVPWLYFVGWVVVMTGLVVTMVRPLRRALVPAAVPVPLIAAVSVLGLLVMFVFLRNPIAARIPDVSVPVGILGAWLVAAVPRAIRAFAWPLRLAVNGILTLVLMVTLLAAILAGDAMTEIGTAGLSRGISGLQQQTRTVWHDLGDQPRATVFSGSRFGRLVAYIERCTAPGDRLFIGDDLPAVYYFSNRRFAAGQMTFFGSFYSSEADQRLAIERWSRQSVPIALLQPPDRFSEEFGPDYPLLAEYVRDHYRKGGSIEIEEGKPLEVWIRKDATTTVDPQTSLPCPT